MALLLSEAGRPISSGDPRCRRSDFALAAAFALAVAPAFARNTPVATARATIKTVGADGATLNVRTRAGEDQTVHLTPKTRFVLVVPATLADVKPHTFVGVAALPGENGELEAMEVHIFPRPCAGPARASAPSTLRRRAR